MPLFEWLVRQAAHYREACDMHSRILTLDTHCDTPMFFPQGVDFGSRDERILVDLHKMTEGRQDATIMVAYLPQPQLGETFSSKVDFDVSGPMEYADLIFDKIEELVDKNKRYLSIARTPADLYADKRQGRRSIMLGIENGLALNGQLQNLNHFAQRGIVYMTLCHNGDNDICDSARGTQTHGGVSAFGREVIKEMNRLGIMVDLSHAAESSFYDALQLSETPIVCSHSSCRALCDHPRNLTDEQMRALAQKGGVMQVTLYNGFLVKDGQATIDDAMRHLQHAIDVMGIDHVGLGTDFDGDGGICGLESSSELLHFTQQLLKRGYSEQDIQKLWGGNFLRVLDEAQRIAVELSAE
jgi:microsomal dipeptidase-like Zn-dependent dipeptidase